MDNTGQLINYIVQELKRGVPDASIRSTLLQNGWPAEPVDRAFAILRQSEPVAPAPAVQLPDVDRKPLQQTQPVQTQTAPQTSDAYNPYARPKRSYRKPLLVAGLIVLLVAVGFGVFSFLNKPLSPTERDAARKQTLQALAKDLSAYYTAKKTYPTRDQLNHKDFATSMNGFEATKHRDPSWTDHSSCISGEGQPVLTDGREKECFGYRVTARNGDNCDANDTKCTRAVLTTTLESGKPYIVVLDKNNKKEY
jgi:hypothetical protein